MKVSCALRATSAWLERRAGWLLIVGPVVAAAVNWRNWRRDKAAVLRLSSQQLAPPDLDETPLVSILIPAWNEKASLERCIGSILSLRYPNKELILCAGGLDGTFDLAARFASESVIVMQQHAGEGKQRALLRCYEQSDGEVVFLTDADCELDDDCFERVLEPLIEGTEDVSTGSWKPLVFQLGNPFVVHQWIHSMYIEVVGGDYVSSLIGRSAAIRRSALDRVGAFKPVVPIGTDLFLSNQLLNAGYRIRFVRDSRVRTRYSESVAAYWRQLSRWYRNPILLGMRTESSKIRGRLNNLRAGSAALFMLGVPALGGAGKATLWGLWTAALSHLVLVELRTIDIADQRGVPGLRPRWRYLRFLPYMVVGWIGTARGFVESLLPWRRWKW